MRSVNEITVECTGSEIDSLLPHPLQALAEN